VGATTETGTTRRILGHVSGYTVNHRLASGNLPDQHLAAVRWAPGRILVEFHAGHMHPELLRDLDEYFRHLSHSSLLVMAPERIADPPDWDLWYERVSPEDAPLCTFALSRGRHNGRDYYRFRVRADMMSQELVDEMHNWQLPHAGGLVRYNPRLFRPKPAAQVQASDALDRYGVRDLRAFP